jgi:serpin B
MAILCGLAFELGLVALWMFSPYLPRALGFLAGLAGHVRWCHYPAMRFLAYASSADGSGTAVLVGFLLVWAAMGLLWAGFFRGARWLVTDALEGLGLAPRERGRVAWVAGVLGAGGMLAWAGADSFDSQPRPFSPAPAVRAVVAGNTALAMDVYGKLNDQPGNVFFSPLGLSTGLGMVHAGARGHTESELARAAHFTLPQAELHPAFGVLTERLANLQRGSRLTLHSANALWAQQGHRWLTPFLDAVHKDYRAQAEEVDFKAAPGEAATRINGWIERSTRGKIPAMVSAQDFNSLTKLVLANAVYFKGNWKYQFERGNTREGRFHVSEDRTVPASFMAQRNEFRAAAIQEPAVTLLELPYYGGDLAMVILLPAMVDGLPKLEAALTVEDLGRWLERLDGTAPHKIVVRLPRFTTRQKVDLAPILHALGAPSVFGGGADLSGMDGTTNLFLSAALQETFVEVNEEGTEAAAVTLFVARSKSRTDSFNADHPFLFLIRDRASGTILFLGRLAEPGA